MKFHEKLDYLMNVTKTTNSGLAMHISIDASHISRLRRGERRLVRNAEYLLAMSSYFIRQCGEEYLKIAIADAAKFPVSLFDHPDKASEKVYQWLLFDDNPDADVIDSILEDLNLIKRERKLNNYIDRINGDELFEENKVSFFYGTQGKREAVLRFLSIILECGEPCELLLYSDESMDWLTEDKEFQRKWRHQLSKVISQGNDIKIIHTVSRNLDEMLESISKWIPLYLTGAIKPYYYPKKRDGIFRRTIFVAPGKVGISGNSIGLMNDKATTILLQDRVAIETLTEELNFYLGLCKPLIHTYTDENRNEYFKTLVEFEKEIENTILNSGELSLFTMPDHVARNIIERSPCKNKNKLMEIYHIRKDGFLNLIVRRNFTEIIKIDNFINIRNGLSKIGYTGINDLTGITYTMGEYRDHLVNMVKLLKLYPKYNLVIEETPITEGYRLYVKEDLGAIIMQNNTPHAVLSTNEVNMTSALWIFLELFLKENKSDKKAVIRTLENIISELEKV